MNNPSGINPQGDRVLVQVEEIDDLTAGGIAVPESVRKSHENANRAGVRVARGNDAGSDYKADFAAIRDRVMFARHAGVKVTGMDGINYRIMNDVDITAQIDDGLELHDLAIGYNRTSLGAG